MKIKTLLCILLAAALLCSCEAIADGNSAPPDSSAGKTSEGDAAGRISESSELLSEKEAREASEYVAGLAEAGRAVRPSEYMIENFMKKGDPFDPGEELWLAVYKKPDYETMINAAEKFFKLAAVNGYCDPDAVYLCESSRQSAAEEYASTGKMAYFWEGHDLCMNLYDDGTCIFYSYSSADAPAYPLHSGSDEETAEAAVRFLNDNFLPDEDFSGDKPVVQYSEFDSGDHDQCWITISRRSGNETYSVCGLKYEGSIRFSSVAMPLIPDALDYRAGLKAVDKETAWNNVLAGKIERVDTSAETVPVDFSKTETFAVKTVYGRFKDETETRVIPCYVFYVGVGDKYYEVYTSAIDG